MLIFTLLCVSAAVATLCVPHARVRAVALVPARRSPQRAAVLIGHHRHAPAFVERQLLRCCPEALARAVTATTSPSVRSPALLSATADRLAAALHSTLSRSHTPQARTARLAVIANKVSSPDLLRSLLHAEAALIDEPDADHFDQLHAASSAAVALSFEALAPMNPDTAVDLIWAAQIYQRRDVTPPHWSRDAATDTVMLLHVVYYMDADGFDTLGDVAAFIEACIPMDVVSAPALAFIAATQAAPAPVPRAVFAALTAPFRTDPSRIAPVVALLNAGAPFVLDELADVSAALELR